MLKKYQPGRIDLLINTDWGIPSDQLSEEEAKKRGMKLFHDRWVIKEEKKQLREEYNTYHSIIIIGYLLIVLTLLIFINIGEISKNGITSTSFAVIYGFVMMAAGTGLIRFHLFARTIAILVFLSFLVLPFTPLLSDDKGSPLIVILGFIGLYYLLRRTARKIFAPLSNENADKTKDKGSFIRKAVYAVLLFLALFVIYTIYDLSQAKRMAADACIRAVPGMTLEDFLLSFPEQDYKIIRRTEHIMIVPKRGLGRNHCGVAHDGQRITASKTGFND